MDLWIRSQNGEVLTKCHCLGLEEQSGSKWSVLNYDGLEFYQYLGAYDYERALEVLDEIQKIFDFRIENKSYEEADIFLKANMFPKIYQMPEE